MSLKKNWRKRTDYVSIALSKVQADDEVPRT